MKADIERFLELPIEPQSEWQGGVVDFAEIDNGIFADSPMATAKMVLWASCETELIHGKPELEEVSDDLVVSELLEFTSSKNLDYRPAHITVNDKTLADSLDKLFANSGTIVSWNPEPELWCAAKAELANHMLESIAAPSLADTECSDSQIRSYAEAAAAFYRARPWRYLDDTDLLQIQTPKPPKHMKYFTVLGAGQIQFGLGFYESPETHWDMRAQRVDMGSIRLFSLTFNPISDAIEKDVAYWNANDLPLETGDAFPQLLFCSRNTARAPKPKELEYVTIVLKALSETTEDEIDSGRWSKNISAQGKKNLCKILIPDLLDPPDQREWIDRGLIPESRGNERHFGLIQDLIKRNEGMELDQLNELINSQFAGPVDDFEYPSETPFDRAENLCYAAIDTYGRRRIQLAREALQEDPTHTEATLLLAEATFDIDEKIKLFRQAVKHGEAQCADMLESEIGHFWSIPETRPWIRAKHGLATALALDGQVNEATTLLLEILQLNQDDNLGVRYEIIPLFLSQNREKEAFEIVNRYSEETANWLYLTALVEYRSEGPNNRSAQKAIKAAIKNNPHVLELLQAEYPPIMPENYELGSPEEAAIIIEEQLDSWTESEGFIEWMFQRAAILHREASKRQRNRKRKSKRSRK